MTFVEQWELRAAFARSLSDMYGTEVPAYTTLLDVSHEVNIDVLAAQGGAAERFGSIERVTAERHGAIRVGTPAEMAALGRIFGAMGMRPVGFYDLREAAKSAVPVVSTAFRPVDAHELARNPFRVFTSVITPTDRRFFSPDLSERLQAFLASRTLFPPALLTLADRAEENGGLDQADADEFLNLATASFELSREPVDRAWYDELEAVSAVASDIGGVRSTHINHLTPRVLDIDELYARMESRGIEMIDDIQGPPRWEGPDVLLRQTSFRALAEPRAFRMPDGSIETSSLRVRFGEVEARGIALTRKGRAIYDRAIVEVGRRAVGATGEERQVHAREVWRESFPNTEAGLAQQELAYFTYAARDGVPVAEPIVYEDFLPFSAAGIFQSNLSADGTKDLSQSGTELDGAWMAGAVARDLMDPFELYAAQQAASLAQVATALRLPEQEVIAQAHQAD